MAILPGAASAQGTITNFSVTRTQSLPTSLSPSTTGFVASALGYPSFAGPIIGVGGGTCAATTNLAGTSINGTNADADQCSAFLRFIDGFHRHEHSPGAFPGLTISASFAGANANDFTLKLPPGQLGNPFAAHQCEQPDPRHCDGHFPAVSLNNTSSAPDTDQDRTEADGSKVGDVVIETDGAACPDRAGAPGVIDSPADGCRGEILQFDPRALTNPDERGAPAAQALVICAGTLATINDLTPCARQGATAAPFVVPPVASTGSVVFAQAGPIDIKPRGEGDYGLDSTIDFTKLEGLAAGQHVTTIQINEFGLIPQSPVDPRQDPNEIAGALPFIFNPTAPITAQANGDASFADNSTSTACYQMFPDQLTPGACPTADTAAQAAQRTWVENEATGYPWNHRELDPEHSTGDGAQNIVTRDKPAALNGDTTVHNFDKFDHKKSVPVETPLGAEFQFTTPTRAGIPYQSHYREIALNLKDTTLSPTVAGKPGFKICTREQFDAGAFDSADCPEGSRIGDLTALSGLSDGDLGPVPCQNFAECSKVNPFVLAHNGCFNANTDPENPCGNLEQQFDPAQWSATPANPGANLQRIPGDVWAGPQVEGHPNQFRVFAQLRNNPDCVLSPTAVVPVGLCAAGSGVEPRLHVKLQGIATADLETGEVHAVFDDLPQLPVFDVTQAFPTNDFSAFTTPIDCGDHKYTSEITPSAALRGNGDTVAGNPPKADVDDTITTEAAPNAPCSADSNARGAREAAPSHGFNPELSFLSDPFSAGQDTAFTTSIKLADRSDNLTDTSVSLPDGVLAPLTSVPMCGRDLARAGNCPDSSQIGTVDVAQGNGGSPLHVPGKVYFSQPGGDGELARITVVVPAKIGPFDLQQTVVNELAVRLRQNGGGLGLDNVGVDKLPTIISGIPVRIREINLKIDRGGFIRNPLNCNTLAGSGTFGSAGGQSAKPTTSFQATGCDQLKFTPKLAATVGSDSSPAKVGGHPSLTTVVTQPDHQASIQKAVVSLPKGLFANVEAVTAGLCSRQQLAADACPATSKVGTASAGSPLLPEPLTGPLYLVDNPGGLPHLVVKLSGLITQELEASTSITQDGHLITTFDGLPNLPVSSFQLNIAGGAKGLFTVGSALCTNPVVNATFSSHTGQTAKDDSPAKLVGSCVPVATPSSTRPSLSVTVRRVKSTPLMTVKARKVSGGANLRTVRIALPSSLVVNAKRLKNGVTVTAGGKRLKKSAWSLTRRGVLTIKTAKKGTSIIAATFQSGSLKTSATLRKAARGRKTLKRLSFAARVVDAKSKQYNYSLKVRPLR